MTFGRLLAEYVNVNDDSLPGSTSIDGVKMVALRRTTNVQLAAIVITLLRFGFPGGFRVHLCDLRRDYVRHDVRAVNASKQRAEKRRNNGAEDYSSGQAADLSGASVDLITRFND